MSVVVLVLVLLLVLAAAGVLVASVVMGEPQWAWISVGCSGVAAVLLVVDRVRRRRARAGTPGDGRPQHALRRPSRAERKAQRATAKAAAAGAASGSDDTVSDGTVSDGTDASPDTVHPAAAEEPGAVQPEAVRAETGEPDTGPSETGQPEAGQPGAEQPEPDDAEPDEEDTDAADSLLVSESDDGVLVVDERPRYHLDSCAWLGSRETIPLSVREARELGFSPCATCGPDANLADRLRARR